MKKNWLKLKNGFLAYSRGDRVGIIVLSILILIFMGIKMLVDQMEPEPFYTPEQFDEILSEWNNAMQEDEQIEHLNFFAFNPNNVDASELDSLALPDGIKRNLIKYRNAGGSFKTKDDLKKLYGMNDSIFQSIKPFIDLPAKKPVKKQESIQLPEEKKPDGYFDPNTASTIVLESYGLNAFLVNNIVAYRNSGGSFSLATDLLKIYGLDSITFAGISKYVEIENSPQPVKNINNEKFLVELNSADSTDLIRLNGIGPVFASRILKYRNLLGGFYTKKQLLEVYGFSNENYKRVESYIYIDTMSIKQIRINYVEYKEMIRHPYFDRNLVNTLLKEKDMNGPIKNINELGIMEDIDSEMVEKIRPYITCR